VTVAAPRGDLRQDSCIDKLHHRTVSGLFAYMTLARHDFDRNDGLTQQEAFEGVYR
jgi:hypothetical protein